MTELKELDVSEDRARLRKDGVIVRNRKCLPCTTDKSWLRDGRYRPTASFGVGKML